MSEGPQIKVDALDATERTTLQNTITWLLTYPTAQWESSRGYPEIETCMSYGLVSMLGRLLSNYPNKSGYALRRLNATTPLYMPVPPGGFGMLMPIAGYDGCTIEAEAEGASSSAHKLVLGQKYTWTRPVEHFTVRMRAGNTVYLLFVFNNRPG